MRDLVRVGVHIYLVGTPSASGSIIREIETVPGKFGHFTTIGEIPKKSQVKKPGRQVSMEKSSNWKPVMNNMYYDQGGFGLSMALLSIGTVCHVGFQVCFFCSNALACSAIDSLCF